jgi:hypothetical protein
MLLATNKFYLTADALPCAETDKMKKELFEKYVCVSQIIL